MFNSKEAMLASIAGLDNQIASLKTMIASLKQQKKTFAAIKTESAKNSVKNIQKDIEQRTKRIKELQEMKKSYKAQGYRK